VHRLSILARNVVAASPVANRVDPDRGVHPDLRVTPVLAGGRDSAVRVPSMKILLDPRLFNFVILGLYALNVIRWAIARSWPDVFYWLSAIGITATVTFGYKH
jgi:hypothetical protein